MSKTIGEFKFYVVSKFFDSGKVIAEVLDNAEFNRRGYEKQTFTENKTFDLYVDGFNSLAEARAFAKESKQA